jgi:hypothetical protein
LDGEALKGFIAGVNQILGGTQAGQKLEQLADRYQALTQARRAQSASE